MNSRAHTPADALPPHERDELNSLLNTLADGGLSEAEERRLREIFDRGEPARRAFREFAALHAVLHWDYATLLAPDSRLPASATRKGRDRWPTVRRAAAFLGAAAMAGAATMAAWMLIATPAGPLGRAAGARLDEWTDRPGFSGTRDGTAACQERADGRMMYDENHLYVAAHVGDPMPLRSIIDPEIDAAWGWRGGAVQVRVSTDRQMVWPARGNCGVYYTQRRIAPCG